MRLLFCWRFLNGKEIDQGLAFFVFFEFFYFINCPQIIIKKICNYFLCYSLQDFLCLHFFNIYFVGLLDLRQQLLERLDNNVVYIPEKNQYLNSYNNNCQSQMQPQNPILKVFTSVVPSECSVTITDISQTELVFEISPHNSLHDRLHSSNVQSKGKKTKSYKVKYDSQKKFRQIVEFLKSFAVRKARIYAKNCNIFKQKIRDILFEELIVGKEVSLFEIEGVELIEAQKYQFLRQLQLAQICQIYNNLHKNRKMGKTKSFQVQFEAQINEQQLIDITKIITEWIKPCKCQFEFQKLSLYRQSVQILSLQKSKQYGLSICLHSFCYHEKLCVSILEIFVKYPAFVSIEFQDWQPSNYEAVDYVFKNYHHRDKYLIKMGNYLEITQLRLFINTTGMKKSEVAQIFNLMKQPGHYQLICHSNKEYFEQAVNLFLYKPLIRFKYFVPLTESHELQSAIDAMVEKADNLRKKIEVLMNMIKSPYSIDISTAIKIFLTMSKTSLS